MQEPRRSFEHQDVDRKTDEALRQEARAHLADTPALQLVAELYKKLRTLELGWWAPEALRSRWSATDRMRWLRSRADLRQQITTTLSGLAPRAARKKTPEFQGALIDSAIDEGDATVRAFEDAFDPADLAIYGPADDLWQAFVERMPWDDDAPVHQELFAWLFDALLADRSGIDGLYRKPILTAWEARTAIDGRVWHTRMPLEIRVAIDDARFDKERQRPAEPFHAESDLSIAMAATIAASIPLKDLVPVITAAQKKMGFGRAGREAAKALPPEPPTQPQPLRAKAVETATPMPPAKPSTPPSPAAQPSPSVTPPVTVTPAHPDAAKPPAVRASTRPPPAVATFAPPPPIPTAANPKSQSQSTGPATKGMAARPPSTIPDVLHTISGEEERTNPWDIPSDDGRTGKGEGR
jgi:hypothetical protein